MTDMRQKLLPQIDTLLDLAERHAWTTDPDERKYALGVIRHVSEVVAPYRYNGPTVTTTAMPVRGKFKPLRHWANRLCEWARKA